jgi:hypothetical protein
MKDQVAVVENYWGLFFMKALSRPSGLHFSWITQIHIPRFWLCPIKWSFPIGPCNGLLFPQKKLPPGKELLARRNAVEKEEERASENAPNQLGPSTLLKYSSFDKPITMICTKLCSVKWLRHHVTTSLPL